VRCGGRELLAAGDDDPVLGLFDDVQCDFLLLCDSPLFVLRLVLRSTCGSPSAWVRNRSWLMQYL